MARLNFYLFGVSLTPSTMILDFKVVYCHVLKRNGVLDLRVLALDAVACYGEITVLDFQFADAWFIVPNCNEVLGLRALNF